MRIADIFYSIQGEGRLVGTPSVFVRASGCNLRCVWCDTPYTSWTPEGDDVSIDEIMNAVAGYPGRHVVVTGGEPMIFPEITELTRRLAESGRHITIETAATVFHSVSCDLASLSPKLSNSTPHDRDDGRHAERHEKLRLNIDVIQQFMDTYDYQLKFVVDSPEDLGEIDALLGRLRDVQSDKVLLMPQGVTLEELQRRAGWVADACKQRGFRYCPRLHIELYGNQRGT
jgi:7-carboxy-7-deazaguanine synthase